MSKKEVGTVTLSDGTVVPLTVSFGMNSASKKDIRELEIKER